MISRERIIPILATFFIINASSAFFIGSGFGFTAQAKNIFHKDQASYAEVSTTSEQTLSNIASSTEKIDLPILVYHIVRPSYPDDSEAVRTLALTPEIFDAEMMYLDKTGHHIVSFSDLENYFRSGTLLPDKPVIISFDDGWSDQFKYSFPTLKKYNFKATFFVFTNSIGRHDFLTWEELQEMLDAGMTIGSHSRSHPYLANITDPDTLWDEIYGSKVLLEKHLGIHVNEFAYPFGQYNADTVAMVVKAGYRSGRGDFYSGKQTADRLYELSAMNAPTTMEFFVMRFPSR